MWKRSDLKIYIPLFRMERGEMSNRRDTRKKNSADSLRKIVRREIMRSLEFSRYLRTKQEPRSQRKTVWKALLKNEITTMPELAIVSRGIQINRGQFNMKTSIKKTRDYIVLSSLRSFKNKLVRFSSKDLRLWTHRPTFFSDRRCQQKYRRLSKKKQLANSQIGVQNVPHCLWMKIRETVQL